MSAHQMARMAELENQAFSLMGRLHVALRRETGRITDVEYMRIDPAYCRHLLQLAAQSGHVDLTKIAERLYEIYFGEGGLFVTEPPRPPLLERLNTAAAGGNGSAAASGVAAAAMRQAMPEAMPTHPGAAMPEGTPAQPGEDQHYVGRLR